MRAGRFFWKLFLGHAALVALVLGTCLWAVLTRFDRNHDEANTADLHCLVWTIGGVGLLGAIALALALAILSSRRISRLAATAHRLSRGDLSIPIQARGSDEVSLLAQSLERMRDRLARQLATIDRQNRMLGSLLAQLHEGVLVTASDGRMVLVNPAAARLLSLPVGPDANRVGASGRRVEDCIQQNDLRQMLLPHSAGQAPMNEARLDIPTEAGVRSILARVSQITLPEPDDDKEAMAHSHHPAMGRLLVLTDITELTRTLQLRSDFVANASHELRTPISAIRAAVDTVLKIDVAGEAETARRFLEVIARHTSRLEALVGDLLDLSRLESPSASFQPTVLRLQRVGDELHDRWSNEIDRKQLRWGWDIADDCPNVFANLYLLQLVLDNLVDNAIKFTDGGGQIGVACRREGRSVEIEVYDTGCGIAPQDHQRVFERFYQVESARSGGAADAPPRGTGLGLSIVKHAVAALGGSVRLDSALGTGTRVTVTIPDEAHPVTHD
jgi:two-component system phosphate regulon sensor histidine kinase PhoR